MRNFIAVLLAAFLAAPVVFAADRPVGPEAGQARTNDVDQVSSPGGSDDGEVGHGRWWWAGRGEARFLWGSTCQGADQPSWCRWGYFEGGGL